MSDRTLALVEQAQKPCPVIVDDTTLTEHRAILTAQRTLGSMGFTNDKDGYALAKLIVQMAKALELLHEACCDFDTPCTPDNCAFMTALAAFAALEQQG